MTYCVIRYRIIYHKHKGATARRRSGVAANSRGPANGWPGRPRVGGRARPASGESRRTAIAKPPGVGSTALARVPLGSQKPGRSAPENGGSCVNGLLRTGVWSGFELFSLSRVSGFGAGRRKCLSRLPPGRSLWAGEARAVPYASARISDLSFPAPLRKLVAAQTPTKDYTGDFNNFRHLARKAEQRIWKSRSWML